MCSRICKTRSLFVELVQSLFVESMQSWNNLASHSKQKEKSARRCTNAAAAALVQLDHRVHRDLMEQTVATASQESLDQTVVTLKSVKDQQRRTGASTALLDHQDQWDDQAHGDLVDRKDSKVLTVRWDLQDHLEDQAQLDQKALRDPKDLLANQASPVCNVSSLDHQDQWDLLERWDLQARKDPMDVTGCQAARVRVVLRAKMAKTELMDRMVGTANKERLAQQVQEEVATTARHPELRLDIKYIFEREAQFRPPEDHWLRHPSHLPMFSGSLHKLIQPTHSFLVSYSAVSLTARHCPLLLQCVHFFRRQNKNFRCIFETPSLASSTSVLQLTV
uniref:Nematode cuticle collagen N-terminal domain-containing protein n=1 Tax=Parascaris univalens TaxID=6257 RepID=A0A915BTU6_PARUN